MSFNICNPRVHPTRAAWRHCHQIILKTARKIGRGGRNEMMFCLTTRPTLAWVILCHTRFFEQ